MRDVLAELTTALETKRPCVWCAIVETRGSTPQKAGAAMLVFADGGQVGTLGGGCVEAEVRRRALHLLQGPAARPEVLTFNLDDNYGWDDGLICGGRMTILADPLRTAAVAAYYDTYRRLIDQGVGCTEAVVLADGERFLFDAEGECVAKLAATVPPETLRRLLPPLSDRPRARTASGVAFLPTLPRIRLLIVGGGHVGHAVAQLAAEVDFEVWVLDDRDRYASAERFPMASRRLIGDIGPTLRGLAPELGPSTYALIVTRGHSHDEEALCHLAPTAAGYVGMIGSRRKIKLIFEDLLARGVTSEALARVHAPLGFEIGSQTVPEIAVSIVAELIARRNLGTTDLPPRRPIVPETTAP
jgi:xanthine dehydrogenase accessory factor